MKCCALTKHKRFVLKRMFFLTTRHNIIFIWVGVSFLPCPSLNLGQLPSVGLNLDHNNPNARVALGPLVHFHLFTKKLAQF